MSTWKDRLFLEGKQKITEYFQEQEHVLLILGHGFDPRACKVAEVLTEAALSLAVCLVDYNESDSGKDAKNESRSRENHEDILKICRDIPLLERQIPMYRGDGPKKILVISESIRSQFNMEFISDYQTIVIDVSAMPRGVGYSIIKRLIDIKAETQKLCVAVCENSKFDDMIRPVIVEESAEYLPGFNTFSMQLEQDDGETVWLPVLGPDDVTAFHIIDNYLKPIKICPVIPFPSKDIQRGERALRSCGEALFRERNVEKRNIIYVPENHPLWVYQKLCDMVRYYEKSLHINQNRNRVIKYAFSSQSSKLIDIGVLLAIMDLVREDIKAGIVVVENQGYQAEDPYPEKDEELYCLCLDDSIFAWRRNENRRTMCFRSRLSLRRYHTAAGVQGGRAGRDRRERLVNFVQAGAADCFCQRRL